MLPQPYNRTADFEAEIRILSAIEGGRMTPPNNGIRWDFAYASRPANAEIYMIHPIFLDEENQPFQMGDRLDFGIYRAWMFVIVEQMRPFHQQHISIGTRFECRKGSRAVALGKVTKLIGFQ